jgi:hypothetical protein
MLACVKDDCPDSKDDYSDCPIDMKTFDLSFGIDYEHPLIYLSPGDQSALSDSLFSEIRLLINDVSPTIKGVRDLSRWIQNNFRFDNAGGSMIGLKTADELYAERTLYGCHSNALAQASLFRRYNIPAVMIETASTQWIDDYNNHLTQSYAGHVMVEAYVEDQWILVENNGTYVDNYDPYNPYISYHYQSDGLLTYAKGLDMWDYGVYSNTDTHNKMIATAGIVDCFEEYIGSNNYNWK